MPGRALVVSLTGLLAVVALVAVPQQASAEGGGVTVTGLRADYQVNPLGTDDATPTLSWQLQSSGRNEQQTGYEVQAASSMAALASGRADLWDTGRVGAATSTGLTYAGATLGSRESVFWRVRAWNAGGRPSAWSAPAHWEMGLLAPSDWSGRWITDPANPVVLHVPAQDSRYLKLNVTKLGLPIKEGGYPQPVSRLQLAEISLVDSANPTVGIAEGASVTASDLSTVIPGSWAPQYLTDGSLTSDQAPFGYTSGASNTQTPAQPVWVQLDLGQVRHFDEVVLYPRTDATTTDFTTPNFPVDYTIQSGATTTLSTIDTVADQIPPPLHSFAAPEFAKQFTLAKPVRSARMYVAGLGVYDARVNGRPVTDSVLQPPPTDYLKRVLYTTYDVTAQLRRGANALGFTLGDGTAAVPTTNGRYQKFTGTQASPRLLAQLEVTYTDGSTARIGTDSSWLTSSGPTTFSSWYGGEDYDARLIQPGWDQPGANLSSWRAAVASSAPTPQTVLSAQSAPPVRQTATLHPVSVTQVKPNDYVFDLGTNIAGWEQLNVSGPVGTKITMWPGEQVNPDGTVSQASTGSPIFDTVTLAGGQLNWHPDFMYHGFRYVEVTGLPSPPTTATITGLELSTFSPGADTFTSSNDLINSIHRIITQAMRNNLFGIPTDCPAREKLGWLEEDQLLFDAISRNYDVAAYFRQFLRTVADSEQSNGAIADIAPEYVVFSGGFVADPNWGSMLILGALRLYQTYGDVSTLRELYPAMRGYLNYLRANATGNLLPAGFPSLGDWTNSDNNLTSGQYTINYAFYSDAQAMTQISAVLGDSTDAAGYRALTNAIGTAFNQQFLHAGQGTYDNGSQGDDALALDMGVVPAADQQAVLNHLVSSITANGEHLTVGEIALPAVFRVLSAAGRDDVIYDTAIQTTSPSYGFQVTHGATALTENWDGPAQVDTFSQDHMMLGAIDAWFGSGLAGIRVDPGAVAGNHLTIQPTTANGLNHAASTYVTPYGAVSSDWTSTNGHVTLRVQIPVGVTATVRLAGRSHQIGSGSYTFAS
ncbi:MAG TPA: family 78 glycoside hydrolase catalytic domain [Pseudonocardiaceae bacterium]|jgi:alpha-L-rhamnosidase|nr:family 78 glycoside hydrolase catalytic domain [Pseudonocardiaceae bacterium]